MTLAAVIRRASASVVPLATRAVRNQRAFSTLFSVQSSGPRLGLCLGQKLTRPSFVPVAKRFAKAKFSTDADENLLRVLESEIECADNPEGEPITDRIPFEIHDNPGERTISLTRKYGDEVIKAVVDKITPPFEDENEDDDGDEDRGDEQDAEEPPSFPMVVTVSKGNGQFLEFGITVPADGIRIDSLSIKNPDISDDQLAYEGPEFEELDENLQKAFEKYLEDRGFDNKVMSFLFEYMEDKEAKEYFLWLNNLKKFVEK